MHKSIKFVKMFEDESWKEIVADINVAYRVL